MYGITTIPKTIQNQLDDLHDWFGVLLLAELIEKESIEIFKGKSVLTSFNPSTDVELWHFQYYACIQAIWQREKTLEISAGMN